MPEETDRKKQLAMVLGALLRYCNENNIHRSKEFEMKYGPEASKAIESMIRYTIYGEMYSRTEEVLDAFISTPVERLIKEANGENK